MWDNHISLVMLGNMVAGYISHTERFKGLNEKQLFSALRGGASEHCALSTFLPQRPKQPGCYEEWGLKVVL